MAGTTKPSSGLKDRLKRNRARLKRSLLRLQMAATRDPVLRDLSSTVQHFLEPYERLFEDDVRARVEAALAKSAPDTADA